MDPICVPSRQQLLTAGWSEADMAKWDYINQWAHHYRKLELLVEEIGIEVECFHNNTRAKRLLERVYKLTVGSIDDVPEWLRPATKQPATPTANAVEQFLQKQGEENQQKEPLRVHSTGQ